MPKKVPILCVNDGRRFETVKDAAASAGVDKSVMHKHLAGKLRTAGGMVYMRIDVNDSPEQIERKRIAKIQKICEDELGMLIF